MKKIILLFLLMSVMNSYAQVIAVRSMAKLEAGPGGFGYEAKLARSITLDMNIGAGGNYEISNGSLNYIFANSQYQVPAVYVNFNPRFYYNLKKRAEKGRSIANNSANYIGAKLKLVSPLESEYNTGATLVNVHWGLQRHIGRKWILNTHAGLGYSVALSRTSSVYYENGYSSSINNHPSSSVYYPSIDIKFAYILSKNKKVANRLKSQ